MKTKFLSLVFLVFATSCVSAPAQQDVARLFKSFYLVHFGPAEVSDFPKSQSYLNDCIRLNDVHCLKAFNEVKRAKDEFLEIPHKTALKITLDTINTKCLSADRLANAPECLGAVTALYFFSSKEDDQTILELLSDSIDHNVLFLGYEWHKNRSEIEAWVSFVNGSTLSEYQKKLVIRELKEPVKEAFGLMLVH